MGLWFRAQILFRNKAPHLLVVNCLVEFLIVLALLLLSFFVKCNPLSVTEIYRWCAVTLAFIAQIYFAYKAIRKGNIVQLKAFLLLSVITTLFTYIKFATLYSQCPSESFYYIEWIVIGLTIVVGINQFFFVLSYRIAKDRFLERMMKEIPAIDNHIESYELWNGLKAMITINFLFQTLILLGYITLYDYEKEIDYNHFYWYIIDGAVYLAFIIFTRVGYVAAVSRKKVSKINGYIAFMIVLQIYEIIRLVLMIIFVTEDITLSGYKYSVIISQTVITVCGIIIQAYTFVLAQKFKQLGPELLANLIMEGDENGEMYSSKQSKISNDDA